MHKLGKILKGLIVVLLVVALASAVYLMLPSYAYGSTAAAVLEQENVTALEDRILFYPEQTNAGLIFYPGGKVSFEAYAPLMDALSREGVFCVLLKMPFDMAFLGTNAADGIPEAYPEIENWYIGGHSLGGSMAASYAAKHTDALKGLVLLAAYSTSDLTGSGLSVCSVYGSEDGVLTMPLYRRCFPNLPADTLEVIIEGGCHAWFGDYGSQSGDGNPTIAPQQQINETVHTIRTMIGN